MIFHLHTPTTGSLLGMDHVPHIGEKLRVDYTEASFARGDEGIYIIEDVVYQVPSDPGRQRIDIYATKHCDLPEDLSYSEYVAAQRRCEDHGGFPAT